LRAILAILIVFLVAFIFYCFDGIRNFERIHKGVTIAGINVGGLTVNEAADVLEKELAALAASSPVNLFATANIAAAGVDDTTADLTQGVTSYIEEFPEATGTQSWSISVATLSVAIDGHELAEQAYSVGRGRNFIFGRLAATFFGVKMKVSLKYSPTQLASLERILTSYLGWELIEAGIYLTDDGFHVDMGKDGYIVDHEAFVKALDAAYLGEQRSIIVPMIASRRLIDEQQAERIRQQMQTATEDPVEFVTEDGEDSWLIDSNELRNWVSTSITLTTTAKTTEGKLVACVDIAMLQSNFEEIININMIRVEPVNARFDLNENGKIIIIDSVDGSGIDYDVLAQKLDALFFGQADASTTLSRSIIIPIGTLKPQLSTDQAKNLHITDKIATFTTEYPGSPSARIHNIHLACDFINGSIIAPDGIWSFHTTVGDCTIERGFQMDSAISDGEFIDAIGGGVCQVATTIFNTVFESGIPIVERTNHAIYLANYPDGRDAAVAWPSVDLRFSNDTPNWMVLIMQYTDQSVTATLWGTDPGYVVTIQAGEWMEGTKFKTIVKENPELYDDERNVITEGRDGKTINVTRWVYDSDGTLLRQTTFKSWYNPFNEVVEVGTKPRPPEDPSE